MTTQLLAASPDSGPARPPHTDLIVIGAGIVGLAHARAAHNAGLSVRVIERDHRAVGASVRNFGHACITAQTGELAELAAASRPLWLDLARSSDLIVRQSGGLAVARSAEEMAVIEELAAHHTPAQVDLLTARNVAQVLTGEEPRGLRGILGGAFLADDLRVDPRTTVATLARHLGELGVLFEWGTAVRAIETGRVDTARDEFTADRILVCVGHDLDYLFPELAARAGVERCVLQMALVRPPAGLVVEPAILSGTSMLRYGAFAETAAAESLREQFTADRPDLLGIGANIMFTQRPDGTLIVGDSHAYTDSVAPFLDEGITTTLLTEIARLLGAENLDVIERWQGVYASSTKQDVLQAEPLPGVHAISVTSGVGMTISLGLGERVIASL